MSLNSYKRITNAKFLKQINLESCSRLRVLQRWNTSMLFPVDIKFFMNTLNTLNIFVLLPRLFCQRNGNLLTVFITNMILWLCLLNVFFPPHLTGNLTCNIQKWNWYMGYVLVSMFTKTSVSVPLLDFSKLLNCSSPKKKVSQSL